MQGKITLSVIGFILCGCAELTTYNKVRLNDDNDKSQLSFIDAKQRVIYSAPKFLKNSTTPTDEDRKRMFCAEPSPDALSAYAASLGVSLSLPTKGELGVNHAFAESAANIGIRTAGIQALRDITFRNCESYMNGGITGFGLETMQRRFQSTLVSVLAIEQLTGAVRDGSVALSSKTEGVNVAALATISEHVIASKAARDKAITTQDTAHNKTSTADTNVKDLKAEKTAGELKVKPLYEKTEADRTPAEIVIIAEYEELIKTKIPEAETAAKKALDEEKKLAKDTALKQDDYDAMLEVRNTAISGGGSTSSTALSTPATPSKVLDKDTVASVSKAVTDIVVKTLQLGFGREVCTTLFGQMISGKVAKSDLNDLGEGLSETCLDYLEMDAKLIQNRIDLVEAQVNAIPDVMEIVLEMAKQEKLSEDMLVLLLKGLFGTTSKEGIPAFVPKNSISDDGGILFTK